MQRYPLILLMFSLLAYSCFKEDERAVPYPGEIITIRDSVQKHQSYFDFESGNVIRFNMLNAWQLGFESTPDGWHIVTNSGDGWFMFNTGLTDAGIIPEMPDNLKGLYDVQHAYPDSTATGAWVTFDAGTPSYTGNIYLLGQYENGSFDNLKQIVFLEISEDSYRFSYHDEMNGNADTVVIAKENNVNFVYYSFNQNKQVNLEPEKASYDMVFGSYYDMATNFGITMPYMVGGALLNIWETSATLDTMHNYDDITYEIASAFEYTSQRDIPGFRWKTVTVDVSGGGAATYAVKTNYSYIIHTAQGNFYKMRFLSYSLDGRSGYPQFEYRLLE